MTDHPATDQMITALDSALDLSDGIDPRTWREVYDAQLVTDHDVARAYGFLNASYPCGCTYKDGLAATRCSVHGAEPEPAPCVVMRTWTSPNGVDHSIRPDGICITCGNGPHLAYRYSITCCGSEIDIYDHAVAECTRCGSTFAASDDPRLAAAQHRDRSARPRVGGQVPMTASSERIGIERVTCPGCRFEPETCTCPAWICAACDFPVTHCRCSFYLPAESTTCACGRPLPAIRWAPSPLLGEPGRRADKRPGMTGSQVVTGNRQLSAQLLDTGEVGSARYRNGQEV